MHYERHGHRQEPKESNSSFSNRMQVVALCQGRADNSWDGRASPAQDCFNAGVMVAEVFSNHRLFSDKEHAEAVFAQVIGGDIKPLLQLAMEGVPQDLRATVRGLLALNPSDRMDLATVRRVRAFLSCLPLPARLT